MSAKTFIVRRLFALRPITRCLPAVTGELRPAAVCPLNLDRSSSLAPPSTHLADLADAGVDAELLVVVFAPRSCCSGGGGGGGRRWLGPGPGGCGPVRPACAFLGGGLVGNVELCQLALGGFFVVER